MSKPDDKKTPPQAPAAATGADALAVVQPAPPAQAAPRAREDNHGRGGLYRIVNGVRQRVGGTQAAPTQPTKAKE